MHIQNRSGRQMFRHFDGYQLIVGPPVGDRADADDDSPDSGDRCQLRGELGNRRVAGGGRREFGGEMGKCGKSIGFPRSLDLPPPRSNEQHRKGKGRQHSKVPRLPCRQQHEAEKGGNRGYDQSDNGASNCITCRKVMEWPTWWTTSHTFLRRRTGLA